MINKSTKTQIVDAARNDMRSNQLSQDAFTEHVKKMNGGQGFSVAYLNDMLKGKFTTGHKQTEIDDKYFYRIAKAIKLTIKKSYRYHHDTDNYMLCMNAFSEARESCMPTLIDGGTGSGKSYAAQEYLAQNPKNTYIVRCDGDLTAKSFFLEFAHSLGISHDGPVYNIRKSIVHKLKNIDQDPCVIIDEGENLKDRSWDSIKRIMDDLKGYCPVIIIAANSFELQLKKKADKQKGCFPQVYRRLREGGIVKLITLELDDVVSVAKPYGITKREHINALFDNCRNMGELTAMLERIMRDHDNTKSPVDELIHLYCKVQRNMRAA